MVTPLASYSETGTQREDLSDLVSVLAEQDRPLFNRFSDQSMACTNVLHEWVNNKLYGYKDTLSVAVGAASTQISVTGSFQALSNVFQAGTIVLVDDEIMRVTAVTSTDLTVTRAVAGTTGATHASGARVEIVGTPRVEGFEPTADRSQFGAKDDNATQIFLEAISLTGTIQAINYVGRENTEAQQLKYLMGQLMKELERAIVMGRQITGDASVGGMMGGFDHFIPSVNIKAAGSVPLTPAILDEAILYQLRNGAKPDLIVASNSQKSAFNTMKTQRVEGAQMQSDRTIDNLVEVYMSEAGPLEVLRSNDVPESSLYLVQSDLIKVVPLQGRRFGIERLAKTRDADQAMIVGEYTMEMRNPEAHYKIAGLATT